MSNSERDQQHSEQQKRMFKKLEQVGFRINLLQVISFLCILGGIGSWYLNRDEKTIIDNSTLSSNFTSLTREIRQNRKQDSLHYLAQRKIDSLILAGTISELKKGIAQDIDHKLNKINNRLTSLENRVSSNFSIEVKKRGPSGPVTLKPVQN